MIVKLEDTQGVENLFKNCQKGLILSCLQNVMGDVYAENCENPEAAMALLGDFCFFAGPPEKGLVMH